jgi:hypothetical protein
VATAWLAVTATEEKNVTLVKEEMFKEFEAAVAASLAYFSGRRRDAVSVMSSG